jgi:hypothetical protein
VTTPFTLEGDGTVTTEEETLAKDSTSRRG